MTIQSKLFGYIYLYQKELNFKPSIEALRRSTGSVVSLLHTSPPFDRSASVQKGHITAVLSLAFCRGNLSMEYDLNSLSNEISPLVQT